MIKTNYLNEYGILIKNDTLILLNENKIDDKIAQIKNKYKKKRKDLKAQYDKAVEKIKDFGKDVGKDAAKDTIEEMNKKIRTKSENMRTVYLVRLKSLGKQEIDALQKLQKIKSISKKGLIATSGLALASIIIATSYQVFKDEKDEITRKCSRKKGKEKEICNKRNRIIALKRRISFLNNSVFRCNYSKDPVKCRMTIDKEILKLKESLRKETINFGKKLRIEL